MTADPNSVVLYHSIKETIGQVDEYDTGLRPVPTGPFQYFLSATTNRLDLLQIRRLDQKYWIPQN